MAAAALSLGATFGGSSAAFVAATSSAAQLRHRRLGALPAAAEAAAWPGAARAGPRSPPALGSSAGSVAAAVAAAAAAAVAGSRGRGKCRPQRRGLVALRVAPWLAEPADLEEAYGIKRRQREVREDGKRGYERPPLQPKFGQRMRNIKPYNDIVEQVERNCHGIGGVRRSFINAAMERKSKYPTRKPPPPTPAELAADSLATSRCRRYAKGLLSDPKSWPKPEFRFPEVAFVGRSNVGKSSLLNKVSLFGTIAAVSDMPGRTKHVSWYRNQKVGLDVLDMPGYGHADRAKLFGPAALEFVKQRTSLRMLYVLIDARHGFMNADHEWLTELAGEGPVKQVVLTKCDLVAPKRLIKIASLVRSDLEAYRRVEHKLLMCSSVTEAGVHDLRIDMCRRCGLGTAKKDRTQDGGGFNSPALELPGRTGQPQLASRMPPPVQTHHQRQGPVDIDEILDITHLESELVTLQDKTKNNQKKNRKGTKRRG